MPTEAAMATAAAGVAAMGKALCGHASEIVSVQEGLRLCVLKGALRCVCGDRPRDVIPGHAGVIVIET